MPIKLKCPGCNKSLSVKEELAGRKLKCPACKAVVAIPSLIGQGANRQQTQSPPAKKGTRKTASKADPEVRRKPTRQKQQARKKKSDKLQPIPLEPDEFQQWLNSSFTAKEVEPVSVTWTYRLAVLMVALVMIALPIIYVGLMAAIVAGTVFGFLALMKMENPALGICLGVIVALHSLVVLLFMLKPLFSRPQYNHGRRILSRSEEPCFFRFVEHICHIVRAPYPSRIEIDSTINASASFEGNIFTLFSGRLRLTVGMPLLAGLEVQQLAGVLAHEFGHFSQGTAMRVSYIVRVISHWLTRVVYERDAWDAAIEQRAADSGAGIGFFLLIVRFEIWLTRRILWVLMLVGHTCSSFLLRQMEYDADRYESRVAGSGSFAVTSRRLTVLNVAHGGALDDLEQFYNEGRLADDLPQLIVLNVPDIPAKMLKEVRKLEQEATTGTFDSHPCYSDRVASIEQEPEAGIIKVTNPATELFQKFGIRSRGVTLDFYAEVFGDRLQKKLLRPVSELVELRRLQLASMKSLRRYFRGNFSSYRGLAMPADIWQPGEVTKSTRSLLLNNRQEVLNHSAKYVKSWRKHSKADDQMVEAKLARTLIDAGFNVPASAFSQPLTSRGQIRQAIDKLSVRQGKAEPVLRNFEEGAAERLSTALKLARAEQIDSKLRKRGYNPHEIDELLHIYMQLNDNLPQLVEIHDQKMILGFLLGLVSDGFSHDAVLGAIHEQMEFLYNKISGLHSAFLQVPYPFGHRRANITLAEYMLKERRLPKYSNPLELYQAAESLGRALPDVHARVLGRLCEFAETVETIAGLSPLGDPDDDEDEN